MKKRWMIGAVIVAVVALFFVIRGGGESKQVIETAPVERGDIRNEVAVTGHLRPLERVDLAFLTGGRVGAVYVEEGDAVVAGDSIARLDAGTLESQVREAEARLTQAQALEADLLAPLRDEERALKDSSVASAETNVAQAKLSAYAALSRAFTYADDAVREEADELFNGTRGVSPKFGTSFTYGTTKYFLNTDSLTRAELSASRLLVEDALVRMEERAHAQGGDVDTLLGETEADIRIIETFLNDVARVVNKYIQTDTAGQAVYDAYQTSVASARSAVATARSDVLAARREYQTSSMALATALRDLELSLAGASDEALAAQRAAVVLAQHGVEKATEQLRDGVLLAPFSGTLANFDLTAGEVVTAYAPVGQLMADAGFELEAYIPEADIADVKLGDSARVTFDAFDRTDIFVGKVVRMALSETIREGVPTYKTTLIITDSPDPSLQLRSGMTADIDILTDGREQVLYVPSRSIVTENGRTFVRIESGGEVEERDVIPGLKGSDGYTEVVSGLAEGERVVLFIEES